MALSSQHTARDPLVQQQYDEYMANTPANTCVLCEKTAHASEVVEVGEKMVVLKNLFPYTMWDDQTVYDHLMVIPRTHQSTLAELTEEDRIEWMHFVATYEARGYSSYTRAPHNSSRSQPHLHTHLLKTD